MMKYKGYVGAVELDEGAGLLHGRVIGTRDVITFQGRTVAEVVQAFRDSVDDYLDFCKERGEAPERPYSGRFATRIAPDLHRRAALAAEAERTSLNAWVERQIEAGLSPPQPPAPRRRRSPGSKPDRPTGATGRSLAKPRSAGRKPRGEPR